MHGGRPFRKAILASIGVHTLIVIGLVLLVRGQPQSSENRSSVMIDTRAVAEVELSPEDIDKGNATPSVAIEPTPVTEVVEVPSLPAEKSAEPSQPLVRKPAIPQTLPPDFWKLLKKASRAEGSIQLAAATAHAPVKTAWAAGGTPIHGELAPKQSIIYVVDMSGSMGEWGKFDTARRALIATLRMQPESVRFQFVVYAGTANVPLRGAPGECLPATRRNVERTIEALQKLSPPTGRSNHVEGLRAALTFRPDLVLIFTDADDLPLAAFRGLLRHSEKATILSIAKVGAAVEKPVPFK